MSKSATTTEVRPTENFECLSIKDVQTIPVDMSLVKSGKVFDIRRKGKRLWITCDDVIVKYPYSANQYKTNSKDGSFVVFASHPLKVMVETIDQVVLEKFITMHNRTILNNMMLTENSIKKMFRPSLYNDTFRLTVNPSNCAVFRSDGSRIVDPRLTDIVKSDTKLSIIVEPTFVWMFNHRIGLRWDARQIKLSKLTFKTDYIGFKPPKRDANASDALVDSISPPSQKNETRKKCFNLVFDMDDHDEQEDSQSSNQQQPSSDRKRYTLLLNSSDDDTD
jgi:hypothetical protein